MAEKLRDVVVMEKVARELVKTPRVAELFHGLLEDAMADAKSDRSA